MTLSAAEIEQFVAQGFVKIDGAFSKEAAAAWREKLWQEAKLSPDDPGKWPPVVRLPGYGEPPHARAFNTPRLHQAYDQLAGDGRWIAPAGIGTFVLRFPVEGPVNDDGWHIDVSFPGPGAGPTDFFNWRANVSSRDRLGLVLLLFTDVGPDDAPTRIRIGSHLPMARRLKTFGEAGESLARLGGAGFGESARLPEALATGKAGTAYICHPFLVHAAQKNLGARPRFLAQPPLQPKPDGQVQLDRADGAYSPVERAIRLALGM